MFVIELVRRDQHKPQHQLAAEATLPQPYISLIEQGRLVPTPEELVRLANALGVHPPALLMERVQPPKAVADVPAWLVGSIAAGVPADSIAPAIRERESQIARLEVKLRAPRRWLRTSRN